MIDFIIEYKLFILAIAAALLFALETLSPLFAPLPEKRTPHIIRNFSFTIFNFITFSAFYGWMLWQTAEFSQIQQIGLFYHLVLPFWFETLLIVTLLDLALYFWHVASHHVPFLWRFHQVHHSDRIIDFSSASRFHIGELFLSACLRMILLIALGASISQILLFEFLVVFFTQFNHTNLRLPRSIEPVLRWFMVTPEMHHIHHSDKVTETNSNYCTTISLWDRLFKTFRWRDDVEQMTIGLTQYPTTKSVSFWKMLLMPFKS